MAGQVVTEFIFDILSFEQGASKVIRGYEEMEAKAKLLAKENPFRGQADDVLKFNNQLRNGTDLFGRMASGPKATRAEVSRLSGELVRLIANQDKAAKSGNWKQTEADIKRTKDRIAEINKQLNETPEKAGKVAGGFDKVGSAIKTAFTVTGILAVIGYVVDFGKKLIDITGISEKYQNQFARIFGNNSEAAKGYLSVLQTTADTTNFTFNDLADNASKLASRGIIPTKNELLGLGDVANFINKDFGQLNEAILDANNPERWKELGFVVKTEGNKMKLSYGDFTTTVDNSVKGAYQAIQAFSQLGKVQGSTVEAGSTLSGQVSTLEDNFAGLFRTIGQSNSGVLNSVIGLISDVVKGATNLYKTLAPAFDGVIKVIGSVYSAVGGLVTSFGNLTGSATAVATTGQKIGFYFNKFVIDPFVLTINIAAQLIESFNTIVIAGELAAAKLSGNKGLAATLTTQFKESGQRLKDLRSDFVATAKDMGGSLDDFTRKDNQRSRRADRRARLNEDELAGFKAPATKDAPQADPKAVKEAAQERQKLLEDKKKFSDDLKALQEKYDKERLDTLDKNSQQYIRLKRNYDLEELEAERQKYILIGQDLTGQKVKNARTGVKTTILNKDYQLPKETEDLYTLRKQNIIDASSRESGKLAEEQFQQDRQAITKAYLESGEQFEKEQAQKREILQRQLNKNELALDDALYNETELLHRKAGESEVEFEQRKAEELLKIKLAYTEAALKLAENDPTLDPAAIAKFRKAIQELKGEVKTLKAQDKDGPKTLFQLLGLQYLDKDGTDITDKVEKQVNAATSAVIDGANQILNQQISSDQAKVDSYDQQIAAKQNEIDTELELQKQGLANNVQLKRQEQAALQAERQKALDQQRAAQAIQLELNAAIQASNLIVAVSSIIKTSAELPLIGQIAAGIQIAAMFALFYSTVSQMGSSIPKYHDGDEVTTQTARSRSMSGARRPDEVDARLQVGEGVIRRKSYQANKALLQQINSLERPARYEDIGAYFRDNQFEMDPAVKERDMQTINQYAEFKTQPDHALHRRVDKLGEKLDALIEEARKTDKSSSTVLPDGRVRHVDANGNVSVVSHI